MILKYRILFSTKFKKDLKKLQKKSLADVILVANVLEILRENGVDGIPSSMKPHKLKGIYKGDWECHIKPNLLIIWLQIEKDNYIKLIRIGSHSDLF